jgi:putative ABC transport system ATP-binding protein
LNDNERSRIRNEKIGFIFQGFNLIPDLSIFHNVEEPLHYRGLPTAERRQRILRSLERVGLSARMEHLPSQLSGGQQQRAAIAPDKRWMVVRIGWRFMCRLINH